MTLLGMAFCQNLTVVKLFITFDSTLLSSSTSSSCLISQKLAMILISNVGHFDPSLKNQNINFSDGLSVYLFDMLQVTVV